MCWAERITEDGQLTTVFHEDGRKKSSRPLISLNDNLEVFIFGIKNLVNALLILILAWTVGDSFTKCITTIIYLFIHFYFYLFIFLFIYFLLFK